MKRLFIQLLLIMSTAAAMAADSTMVRFGFKTTADDKGMYNATLRNGAVLKECAGTNILALGPDDGYLDLGTTLGDYIGSLKTFTIYTDIYVPEETNLTANGNFVWCFAKSSSDGYLFFGAKDTRYAITRTNYSGESGSGLGRPLAKGKWMNVTVVVKQNASTKKYFALFYLDGTLSGSTTSQTWTLNPAEVGNTVMNYLGKSCYTGDVYLKNAMYHDFRIYNYTLSPK